jgi:hypothetical protein
MQNDTDSPTSTLTPSSLLQNDSKKEESNYIIEINDALFSQMEKQIDLLKKHDIRQSLQSWTVEALREKMLLELKSGSQKISKEKILKLVISERLRQYIENRVLEIKGFRRSYSKKKWVLDAIAEKLERDKNRMDKLIDEIYSPLKYPCDGVLNK